MNSGKFAKPWQAMPSRIISLALEHAQQNTDFDHQLAFLLLDVGVESALKTYLINKKQDVEKIFFPDLLKRAGDELRKDNLEIPLDEIEYFHKTRNKLYHQGDGVKPTQENLTNYAKLAKTILKILLDVDTVESIKQELVPVTRLKHLIKIRQNIESLEFNSLLMVEQLYPHIASRKTYTLLMNIRTHTGPDDESYPPSVRADFVRQRIDAFNEITGWEFTEEDEHDLIESVIDAPERLYVCIAFAKIVNENWRREWEKYISAADFLKRQENKISETDDKKYEETHKWTAEKAHSVYEWVSANIPDVTPKATGEPPNLQNLFNS